MWDLIVSVPDDCLSFYFETERVAEALVAKISIFSDDNLHLYHTTEAKNNKNYRMTG